MIQIEECTNNGLTTWQKKPIMSNSSTKLRGGNRAKKRNETQEEVDSPLDTDVILGKTIHRTTHPGNARYYELLKSFLPQYMATNSRTKKSRIIREIFNSVSCSGRFLKKSSSRAEKYVVVNETVAKSTIGHAIRYQETLSQQRKIQPSMARTEAPSAVFGTGQPPTPLVHNDCDGKPPAEAQRQNQMTVPLGLASSFAPQTFLQRRGFNRSLIMDPQMVEFAFEFDLSGDESTNDQAQAYNVNGNHSDSSLFSNDELDAVLSVASSVPTRLDSPTARLPSSSFT